ncbi:MAG: hypothetical protein COA44_00140 [Arcobacter sp.]|nr:MAG: hypothetical protein COA44_00140 [Arcobacter sp.]
MLKYLTLSISLVVSLLGTPYQSFYDYKVQEFSQMSQSKLVFLGDSLTMRHNWSNFKAANMGIDGDTTGGVYSRVHQASNADTIVLMIGVNDILNQVPLSRIQTNYTKILNNFNSKQKIYILSLLPVIDEKLTKKINQDIKEMNKWLENELKQRNFTYLNFYPKFLDMNKKGLAKALTTDGIHLSPKAYKLWEKNLKEVLSSD